jgi:hypothetical protein
MMVMGGVSACSGFACVRGFGFGAGMRRVLQVLSGLADDCCYRSAI